MHERGVLLNGDNLICQDATHQESWINWRYSIIRQEINKRVRNLFAKALANFSITPVCPTFPLQPEMDDDMVVYRLLTSVQKIRERGTGNCLGYIVLIYISLLESNWFSYTQKVDAECRDRTARCSCQFASLGREGRESYTVQVDCSGRQLTTLPAKLPDFTNELDVSENDVNWRLLLLLLRWKFLMGDMYKMFLEI